MSTATITANGKPGGNGATPATTTPVPPSGEAPQPAFAYRRLADLKGPDYVRGWECLQLLHIVEVAYRAAQVCASTAQDAPTETACRTALMEALTCVSTAEHYTRMLLDQIAPSDPRLGPEF